MVTAIRGDDGGRRDPITQASCRWCGAAVWVWPDGEVIHGRVRAWDLREDVQEGLRIYTPHYCVPDDDEHGPEGERP
jgi:hypothetical protein